MSASERQPVVTFTTDFGLQDHYAGTMKGVVLSRCPSAKLVDISHDIAAFSVYAAAYTIDQAAPYFPASTIHVIVVDPGVGTARKALLLEALGQYFIAPDNGVLSMIAERDGHARARELSNRDLWLPTPSSTFHGRDVFAPVAGALASHAAKPEAVGPPLTRIEMLPGLKPERAASGAWQGRVLSVDHFGNAITNFRSYEFSQLSDGHFEIGIGESGITEFHRTFNDAPRGHCFAYFGSSGYVEVGMNQGHAAEHLRARPGDALTLRLHEQAILFA